MVATFHLLASCHVACVEVARENNLVLAQRELKSGPLRMHVSELLLAVVAHDALDGSSLWLLIASRHFAVRATTSV